MSLISKKNKINSYLFFLIFFLVFIGFYSILLLGVNAGLPEIAQTISIPLRFVIVVLCLLLITGKLQRIKFEKEVLIYIVFFVIYLFRVFYDYSLHRPLYIEYSKLILYFISFSVIPFVVIASTKLSKEIINSIFKGFLYSSIAFSFLATLLYGKYIGTVARLASNYVEDDVLSPLILSYCSALGIGVLIMYLIYNKTTRFWRFLISLTIIMNLVPFYLGASRGSILALFIPFLFLVLSKINIKVLFKSFIFLAIFVTFLYYTDIYLGSGLFDRFLSIGDDVEFQSSSASRLGLWSYALEQFVEYPFFGDKLQTNNINMYPHNVILEVLQAVGFLGAIPLFILLYKAFGICKKIFINYSELAWIPVIFIQAFVQNMFSGAIYTASWLWGSMALLFALNYFIKHEKK